MEHKTTDMARYVNRSGTSRKCSQGFDLVRSAPFPGRFAPRIRPAVAASGWLSYPQGRIGRRATTLLGLVFVTLWHVSAQCSAQTPLPVTNGQPPIPAGAQGDRIPGGPAIASQETLEDAWRIALAGDQRVEAGDLNVSAADHAGAAARAECFPSLDLAQTTSPSAASRRSP